MTQKDLIDVCNSLDWNVSFDNDWCYFQMYSPCGQDFNVQICTADNEFLTFRERVYKELIEYYDNFDVDTETYLWLDSDGHGKNGAPHRMIDLWNDMNDCHEKIWELAMTIKNTPLHPFL